MKKTARNAEGSKTQWWRRKAVEVTQVMRKANMSRRKRLHIIADDGAHISDSKGDFLINQQCYNVNVHSFILFKV